MCFLLMILVLVRKPNLLNSFQEMYTCRELVWPWWCVGWYDIVILSWLASIVYSNCRYSSGSSMLYVYRYHVTLCTGQLHSITVYRTGIVVGAVLVLSVIISTGPLSDLRYKFVRRRKDGRQWNQPSIECEFYLNSIIVWESYCHLEGLAYTEIITK